MTISPSAEDRFAIKDLFAKYAWALDTGDADSLVDCFSDDALLVERPPYRHIGTAALREFFNSTFIKDPTFPGRQHPISQMRFEPDREGRPDHWYIATFWTAADFRINRAQIYGIGWYEDVVCRTPAGWRFRQRIIQLWEGELLSRFPPQQLGGMQPV
jgi:hypothetical protein